MSQSVKSSFTSISSKQAGEILSPKNQSKSLSKSRSKSISILLHVKDALALPEMRRAISDVDLTDTSSSGTSALLVPIEEIQSLESQQSELAHFVDWEIEKQKHHIADLNKLVENMRKSVMARAESHNKMCTIIEMKQLKKYEAAKESAIHAMNDLNLLAHKISAGDESALKHGRKEVEDIISRPMPKCTRSDNDILEEAHELARKMRHSS